MTLADTLLAALIGYALGSIPWAYILVRAFRGIDIRTVGSKNVGTLNAYRATGSKALAGAVLLLDLAKAVVAYLIVSVCCPDSLWVLPFAVVLGHNYPVWLKFRGGRGIAVFLVLALLYNRVFFAAWILLWLVGYLLSGYIAVGALSALILAPILAYALGTPVLSILLAEIPIFSRYVEKIRLLIKGELPKHYWRSSA